MKETCGKTWKKSQNIMKLIVAPRSLSSLEFLIFIISTSACLNLLSTMRSINYRGQIAQETLQNKYL